MPVWSLTFNPLVFDLSFDGRGAKQNVRNTAVIDFRKRRGDVLRICLRVVDCTAGLGGKGEFWSIYSSDSCRLTKLGSKPYVLA